MENNPHTNGSFHSFASGGETAKWRENETCSFCGSLKPSRFLECVKAGKKWTPTDKSYKAYIETDEGEKKCYFEHFSESEAVEIIMLLDAGKINFSYPGHLYSGLCFAKYKDAIEKARSEKSK